VNYLPRTVDCELAEIVAGLPTVAIDGAKGVGKTATASRFAVTTLRLDSVGDVELLRENPGLLGTAQAPVLIDEWQRYPPSWDLVRRAVDAGAKAGSFMLTGSASPRALRHSGAGRIVRLRMRPLGFHERGLQSTTVSLSALMQGTAGQIDGRSAVNLDTYVDQIIRSGFPGIWQLSGRNLVRQLDGYVDNIVEHDFTEMGHCVRRPEALRSWLTAYAAATGTTASYEEILNAATPGTADKPARSTTEAYRDALTRLWLIDRLPAWQPVGTTLNTLAQSPKHYLADPALAACLLGVGAKQLVAKARPGKVTPRATTLLGALFEHLVVHTCRVLAQPLGLTVSHLRTRRGEHEVDLILQARDGAVLAVEAKAGGVPDTHDVSHLKWLRDKLGDRLVDAVVLNTGDAAYRRADGVAVVPLALLGE
jgi:predicted AAA+ superfamily ATPase